MHVYPLVLASCEIEDKELRLRSMECWAKLQSKVRLGNLDRWVDIIREVWRRRGIAQLNRGTLKSGLEDMPFEKTVRGSLHWLGVMTDRKWEGTYNLIITCENSEPGANSVNYSVASLSLL